MRRDKRSRGAERYRRTSRINGVEGFLSRNVLLLSGERIDDFYQAIFGFHIFMTEKGIKKERKKEKREMSGNSF